MAKIPQYERRVAQQPMQIARVIPKVAGGGAALLAQGLGEAANEIGRIQAKQRQEADTTALIEADSKLSNWQNQALYDPNNGLFTKKGKDALGAADKTMASFDEQTQSILSELSNDAQRRRFQAIAASKRESLMGTASHYQFGQIQRYQDDTDSAAISTAIDTATLNYSNPGEVEKQRKKAMDIVDSQAQRNGWSPEQTQEARTDASSKILSGAIIRMADGSSRQAKEYYEASKGGLNAEAQIRLNSTIEQSQRREEAEARQRLIEQRQLQAIARVELSGRVQDAQAAYLQGLDFANPPNMADFKAAYGDSAAEQYQSFRKVQDVAPAIREFATATPDERQQLLQKFKPAADGTATAGFAEDSQLYKHLATVGAGLLKQQQEDPGAYVMQYAPAVRQAFERAQQEGTPEAHQAYVDATRAEQHRLGVQSPQVLPKAAAEQLASQFNQQIAAGGTDNAATLIEGMQAQWGKNFGAVIQQVGDKLPAEAQVIATGVPKNIAERLAAVAPIPDKELRAGLEKGQADEIQQTVSSELAEFGQSLQHQAGGISTYNTIYQAAVRTATAYVRQGETPKAAAQKVVAGIINDKYDFAGTYRIPKALDTSAIRSGAAAALESVKGADLMPLPGLRGVTPEANAGQLEAAVRSGGEWVTNNDETGLVLTVNGYALRDRNGKPFTRTWQDLTAAGLGRKVEPSPSYIEGFVP